MLLNLFSMSTFNSCCLAISLYTAASRVTLLHSKLGFLLLAVRGAFVLPGQQAFLEGNFTLRDEAQSWPLLYQVDQSTGQLKVIMLDKVQYEVHVNCLNLISER